MARILKILGGASLLRRYRCVCFEHPCAALLDGDYRGIAAVTDAGWVAKKRRATVFLLSFCGKNYHRTTTERITTRKYSPNAKTHVKNERRGTSQCILLANFQPS
eukprot:6373603-Amphidinium_carterae.1